MKNRDYQKMKKFASILSILSIASCSLLAQDTMYVHQEGPELLKIPLNQIDSLTFNANNASYVTDYDGNHYHTIEIEGQTWMAENLKTTHYNDGTPILLATNNTDWENNLSGAYCWYNNDEYSYKETYGALYNWYTVKTNKLCPTGWHVPSAEEWRALRDTLHGSAGSKLRETGSPFWKQYNLPPDITNETGFSALPGGVRWKGSSSDFDLISECGYWWTTSKSLFPPHNQARSQFIRYSSSLLWSQDFDLYIGISVRCLKD